MQYVPTSLGGGAPKPPLAPGLIDCTYFYIVISLARTRERQLGGHRIEKRTTSEVIGKEGTATQER